MPSVDAAVVLDVCVILASGGDFIVGHISYKNLFVPLNFVCFPKYEWRCLPGVVLSYVARGDDCRDLEMTSRFLLVLTLVILRRHAGLIPPPVIFFFFVVVHLK